MRIYKTHFMPANTIYQLIGKPEWNIRDSYSGGAVDVYIPHNVNTNPSRILSKDSNGKYIVLYYYDVNSLYPTTMAKMPMPVGKPIAFEGNIRLISPKAYGFFNCIITSPLNLEHPILQRRIKTTEGIRTVAGLGTWTGWICSTEMDNAMKYGYTFEILNGYEFNTGDIFSEYINTMYNLRKEFPKSHPMNLIAKLLMNSLYGKFGIKSESTKVEIIENNNIEKLNKYLDKYHTDIDDIFYFDNYTILIIKTNKFIPDSNRSEIPGDISGQLDINVAVASAITAYGRIHMSVFKNNPDYKLYYSDTDSGVINKPLPDHMIGNELGQMKLEHTIKKAIFLAPKVYGLVDINDNEIIKAKGLTKDSIKNLKVSDLELLLRKDITKIFTQEKGYKSLFNANINVLDTAYTLKATSNKRQHIYNKNIFVNTKPYNFDDIKSNKLK
jgi:hypothetical protein